MKFSVKNIAFLVLLSVSSIHMTSNCLTNHMIFNNTKYDINVTGKNLSDNVVIAKDENNNPLVIKSGFTATWNAGTNCIKKWLIQSVEKDKETGRAAFFVTGDGYDAGFPKYRCANSYVKVNRSGIKVGPDQKNNKG